MPFLYTAIAILVNLSYGIYLKSILCTQDFSNTSIVSCHINPQRSSDEYILIFDNEEERWRLWISDLIGWSQYNDPPRETNISPSVLNTRNHKTRDAIVSLLTALDIRNRRWGSLPDVPKPLITPVGQKRFIQLLNQMEDLLVSGSLSCEGTYTTPLRYNSQTEATVRKWISDFEAFPSKYPTDRYLSGYARLYALILRLQWDNDIKPLSTQFLKLKQAYADSELIGLMTDWYKCLLLCYLEPSKQQSILKTFYSQHKEHPEWFVVQLAQKYMGSKSEIRALVYYYFCSALRRNSKGIPPAIIKHKKNNFIGVSPNAVRF